MDMANSHMVLEKRILLLGGNMSKSENMVNKKYVTKNKDGFDYRTRMTEWLRPDVRWFPKQMIVRKYAELNGWDWWRRRIPTREWISNKEWLNSEEERMAAKGIKTKIRIKKMMKAGVMKDFIALFMEQEA